MAWVETANTVLRYCLSGAGQGTVVLIHEAAGCIESLDEVAAILEKRYRVLRYDQRGFGLSERVASLNGMTLVDDLSELLDSLGIGMPVHLAGGAYGGDIAALFAASRPERVASLTIASPRTGGYTKQEEMAYLSGAERVAREGLRAGLDARLSGSYPEHLRAIDPARFAQYRARWLCNSPECVAALMRLLPTLDLSDCYSAIRCPTLVIGVNGDHVRPPEFARRVADAIPTAEYRLIDSGHHFAVQSPELFAQIVSDFIDRIEVAE